MARSVFGRLRVIGASTNSDYVWVECKCGSPRYEVRKNNLIRHIRPLRNCRHCGYVATGNKVAAAKKIPQYVRAARAAMGGSAARKNRLPQWRQACEEYLSGRVFFSQREIAARYNVCLGTVVRWLHRYRTEMAAR